VVKTVFARALYEGREEQVAAAYPAGRLGLPSDVGNAVAYLLSDEAGWITGQTWVLDGGVMLTGGLG
jgi:NAD(P)-dependent dehydrogenase (short-subunit alcohol dehydrogenase family)